VTERSTEILVGAGVLAVAAVFLFYAGQIAGIGSTGGSNTASYTASFRSIQGISVGTDVRLAGVKVGTVASVELNPETFRAETRVTVDDRIALPEDTTIVVASEGLLGGSFIELVPGGLPTNIEPGTEIYDTQGAVSLITLLLRFVSGGEDET